ncbi:hypothetical protein AGDE_09070 [Angomonas deanei]|uniref:Cancer susceptibility candidate 1 N-terminus, putative n=1 Tax=Angomonas deanei TaxID=59799 RepID=A0A7G2C6Q9_9TRYP|nr:hypothetical protein AGDE_09070 [Angomonas deanei]CAD2214784.1 Cancer susceptibility candidate 1 N-terminus, putative [Angomonas deanei]|eukprot:EPY31402.1 hypothetical protein AGDE_09070 [Angomonas deanei]
MPPKRSKSKGKEEKPTKAAAQQAVMEEAAKEAEKMYLKHEEERRQIEKVDKKQSDFYLLDSSVEKERLSKERELFQALRKSMTEDEALAFREYYKHLEWEQVPSASNLPDVNSEAEINTFLSAWKDEQTAFDQFLPETQVYISRDLMNEMEAPKLRFYRGENSIPAAKQKTLLDAQFQQCIDAYRLTEAIKVARDKAISTLASAAVQRHNQNLQNVFDQIQRTMDFLSIQLLLYYDRVIDAQDGETYMRMRPEETPIIKFGQWIKVREITRSFISLLFPDLDIRLDPKSNANPKLPKALGLSKEDVSLRVVQYSFDPFSAYSAAGKEYYALNCTIKADLISFSGRPTQQGQWLMRSETTDSHSLKIESYPPQNSEARAEDPSFRLSFDVPTSICVRTGTLVVGKWLEATKEWEPCTHTTLTCNSPVVRE